MTAIDIRKQISKYKKGWVALDKSHQVVESANSFEEINRKLEKHSKKEELLLLPVSDKYFGFIT